MRTVTRSCSSCIVLSALALIAGCTDPTSSPRLLPGGVSLAAVQSRGEGTFVGNGVRYFDCIGEPGAIHVEIPYRFHRVETPSGAVHFVDPFIPQGATGTLVGETTGRVWTLDRAVSPDVIQSDGPAGAEVFVTNLWYVNASSALNFHNSFRFHENANGDIVVDEFEIRCIGHGV